MIKMEKEICSMCGGKAKKVVICLECDDEEEFCRCKLKELEEE